MTSGANLRASWALTGPSSSAPRAAGARALARSPGHPRPEQLGTAGEVAVAERRRTEPEHGAVPVAADQRLHHQVDALAVVLLPVGLAVAVAVVRVGDRRVVGADDEHDRVGVVARHR